LAHCPRIGRSAPSARGSDVRAPMRRWDLVACPGCRRHRRPDG
jgi:hypothetical protein